MHARIAKLESDVGHIQADVREIKGDAKVDFRLLFGALIAAAIGLAGLMARGFGWLG